MTVILTDNFAGANGDPWDVTKWALTGSEEAVSATIQGNRGRLAAADNSTPWITMEAIHDDSTDTEVTGLVVESATVTPSSVFGWIIALRTSATFVDPNSTTGTGYYLRRSGNSDLVSIVKRSGTQTTLDSFTGPDRKQDCRFRFQVIGTDIRAKVWLASGSEPGAWDLEASDAVVTGPGGTKTGIEGVTSTSTFHYDIDDIVIETLDAVVPDPLPTIGSGWGIPIGIP